MSNTHANGQSKTKPKISTLPIGIPPLSQSALVQATMKLKDEKVIQAVVMSPHSSISNDASRMVELAAQIASATNNFNTDVAATIAHLRDEIDKLNKYEERINRWFEEEASAMAERHAEELNDLKTVQLAEAAALTRSKENSSMLTINLRATLDGLLAKFSKPVVEPKE